VELEIALLLFKLDTLLVLVNVLLSVDVLGSTESDSPRLEVLTTLLEELRDLVEDIVELAVTLAIRRQEHALDTWEDGN
jgi:hypothetical protein